MSQTTINHLPPEMLLAIFKNLSARDLFEKMPVCKLWNEVISLVKIERLSVDADLDPKERWYHSKRPGSESQLCHPNLFVAHHKKSTFSNLKYLRLHCRLWNGKLKDFDFNDLNTFKHLVHLELFYYPDNKLYLNLPNLLVLYLDWPTSQCNLEIDCENLSVFHNRENADNDSLLVHHPNTIRVLDTGKPGTHLAQFKNVECLRYRHFDRRSFDSSILLNLKNLKVIHYDFDLQYFNSDFFDVNEDTFEDILQELRSFMQKKRTLGRSDLTVYFSGLRLAREDLSDINFALDAHDRLNFIVNERLYMRNYDRVRNEMGFIRKVNYNQLLRSIQILPGDYFSRFFNLDEVTATCPLNEQHFLQFLKNIERLKFLRLYDPDLSQGFFESLPEFCSLAQIELLREADDIRDNEIELNFDFIRKFNKMNFIRIDYNLSRTSMRTFIASFRNLRRVFANEWPFKFRGRRLVVKRNGRCYDEHKLVQSYDLIYTENEAVPGVTLLKGFDLDAVIDYLEQTENWGV